MPPGNLLLLNILVTEDNPGDFLLLEELLHNTELVIGKIYQATLLSEALAILSSQAINLVFLDLHLPDSSGIDSYMNISGAAQRIPVILLTGLTDTNTALQALLLGAQDYLIKGEFDGKLLARAIRYSIERKRNLENLRDSEERYRELFNNNPMPMWVFDAETFQFLEVNDAAIHHYGYSYDEFLGRTILSIRPREDAERVRNEVVAGLSSKEVTKKGVWKHIKKNGESIFVEIASHNIEYMNRKAVLVLANDVTERIRLEKELNEQRVLKQKQITEAVILAQERERTEIGKELHDNVNQILGATCLYINTAITDETIRQDLLERSVEFINNAINEIRKISKSLITPGIREIGLIDSIEDIIEDFKMASSLKIDFDKRDFPEESIDDHRKLTIFRIIQEQLNNIIKHAKASEVLISLRIEGDTILLVVADNGQGFDTSKHRKGVGITNIISRTELFNGKVNIRSTPGEGCVLKVSLPVAVG